VWSGCAVLLLKISQQLSDCLARAAEARERADAALHPEIRQGYLDVERYWMRLADSLRFVETVDRFLDDASRNRAPIKPLSPLKADNSHITPIACEKCGGKAHLTDCAPCIVTRGAREIWNFKCETCGAELKRVAEK